MLQPTEVLFNSRQFKKLYDKLISDMASHYGLTPNEVNILLFLANNPECDTATDIAEARCLAKSCVSRSVDSLIRQGFLSAGEDEKDRRILHLSILPAAADLVRDAQLTQETFLSCVFEGFSETERRAFDHLTEKILHNIREALRQ